MIAVLLSALLLTQGQPTAAQLEMARADMAFKQGNFQSAKTHIKAALDTGELNDIGTTILYWNLHYCNVALGQQDEAADAVLGFIVHARNVDNRQFIKEYELETKLATAEVMLEGYWARKSNVSCRSKAFACKTETKKFDGIRIFGSMLPFCGNIKAVSNLDIKRDKNSITVNVTCANKGTETYYFYDER